MKVKNILDSIEYTRYIGDDNAQVLSPCPLDASQASEYSLFWCKQGNEHLLKDIDKGTVIVGSTFNPNEAISGVNYIMVFSPRKTFMGIMNKFFKEKPSLSLYINNVYHGDNLIYIGNNVTIEEGCEIGNNVVIWHNSVIFRNTIIGDNVTIGANTSIGGVGFGYEKDDDGNYQLIQHLGNVVIGNNVDIGNNTAIDRAVLGSTIIEDNVKIDNLVHIAHGVRIGKNSMVIANAMLAGSVTIGEGSWIAPSSSVLNQKSVGNNAVVGLGAVVINSVNDNEVVVGNPSKVIKYNK
jgi:UDP-3-O-[3-hydroxymyristoyl] glucosamine N-acyltransferase